MDSEIKQPLTETKQKKSARDRRDEKESKIANPSTAQNNDNGFLSIPTERRTTKSKD
jgi:pectin methylesterase-like acyl-CoA thioesterase